jgi:hypothetical protein
MPSSVTRVVETENTLHGEMKLNENLHMKIIHDHAPDPSPDLGSGCHATRRLTHCKSRCCAQVEICSTIHLRILHWPIKCVQSCKITFYYITKHHTMSGSHKAEGTSFRIDSHAAFMNQVHSTQASLSEPEDGMSSDVESFDEEDMYPANYNDESVSSGPDSDSDRESQSPLRALVCASLLH